MTPFARPSLAIVFGAFIVCTETCFHFDSVVGGVWLDMPWHDWIAGAALAAAGLSERRGATDLLLPAAWAFMLSLLVGAFFNHLADWLTVPQQASDTWLSEGALLGILSALIGIAASGLFATLAITRSGSHQSRSG